VAVALDDRDRARLDREEVVAVVALAEQDLARLDGTSAADRAQARTLLLGQPREAPLRSIGSAIPAPIGSSVMSGSLAATS